MPTSDWGPAAWKFLHTATFAYGGPDGIASHEEQAAAKNLFESLRLMLPCKDCCSHYCGALQKRPLTSHVLKNRDNLSRWLVDLHNDVNERLGKPIVSFEEAVGLYESLKGCSIESANQGSCDSGIHYDSTSTSTRSSSVTYIVVAAILLAAIALIGLAKCRK